MNWKTIKDNFNKNGEHEGIPVIVWDNKTGLPVITAYYSSQPSNLFSNGTYTHFIIAPKKPQ